MKRERSQEQNDDPPCCVCFHDVLEDDQKNYPFRCGGSIRHLICDACWSGMKHSGRTLVCPLCRGKNEIKNYSDLLQDIRQSRLLGGIGGSTPRPLSSPEEEIRSISHQRPYWLEDGDEDSDVVAECIRRRYRESRMRRMVARVTRRDREVIAAYITNAELPENETPWQAFPFEKRICDRALSLGHEGQRNAYVLGKCAQFHPQCMHAMVSYLTDKIMRNVNVNVTTRAVHLRDMLTSWRS